MSNFQETANFTLKQCLDTRDRYLRFPWWKKNYNHPSDINMHYESCVSKVDPLKACNCARKLLSLDTINDIRKIFSTIEQWDGNIVEGKRIKIDIYDNPKSANDSQKWPASRFLALAKYFCNEPCPSHSRHLGTKSKNSTTTIDSGSNINDQPNENEGDENYLRGSTVQYAAFFKSLIGAEAVPLEEQAGENRGSVNILEQIFTTLTESYTLIDKLFEDQHALLNFVFGNDDLDEIKLMLENNRLIRCYHHTRPAYLFQGRPKPTKATSQRGRYVGFSIEQLRTMAASQPDGIGPVNLENSSLHLLRLNSMSNKLLRDR